MVWERKCENILQHSAEPINTILHFFSKNTKTFKIAFHHFSFFYFFSTKERKINNIIFSVGLSKSIRRTCQHSVSRTFLFVIIMKIQRVINNANLYCFKCHIILGKVFSRIQMCTVKASVYSQWHPKGNILYKRNAYLPIWMIKCLR